MSEPAVASAKPEDEAPSHHFWSHLFNVVVFVGGSIALAWMMHSLGWANARKVFENVGPWFILIVALDMVGMGLDAAAIYAFMLPEAQNVSFWKVFAAQASGRAINIFVPGGVVGETTKVTMLVTVCPHDRVVSSIVLFNLATFYMSVAIVLIGVPITMFAVDLPHSLKIVVLIAIAILVPLVIVLAVLVHRGALGSVISSLRGMRLISKERAVRWREKLGKLDSDLQALHSDHTPGTKKAVVFLVAERLVSWTATIVVLAAVGVHLHPILLVGVLSVGVLISWISAIVPFGLGLADGSNYALFSALGAAGANGVFVTLLNRARTLVIALFGFVVMAIAHFTNRTVVKHRHRRHAARLASVSRTTLA
ncbi:hypothetical protein BH11MYX1_BH11MYX1_20820 [soil metagenome]